jgi:uncharacterized protein YjaG (DUF416 family)
VTGECFVVKFDRQLLKGQLEGVGPRNRALFALSCAERLFPLYQLYFEKTGCGRPSYLRSTLDHLWELALRGQTGHKELFLNDFESLLPGEDPAWNPLNGLADDAIAALAYACQCQATGEIENAVWAAERGYAAVDYVARDLEGMDYGSAEAEAAIQNKEYVQAEIKRQLRDVAELVNVTRDGSGIERVVESFQNRAKSEGMTLIPIVSAFYK